MQDAVPTNLRTSSFFCYAGVSGEFQVKVTLTIRNEIINSAQRVQTRRLGLMTSLTIDR